MGLLTSADYFHMHPSLCSLDLAPRLVIWFDCPWRGMVLLRAASGWQEPRFGAEKEQIPQNRHGVREKEPPSLRLRRNTRHLCAITVQTRRLIAGDTNYSEGSTYVPKSHTHRLRLRVGFSRCAKFFPRRRLSLHELALILLRSLMPCGKVSAPGTLVLPTEINRPEYASAEERQVHR